MNISILGSTGSIGTQTLDIVRINHDMNVVALAANKSIDLLYKQILEFSPELVCVYDEEAAGKLEAMLADAHGREELHTLPELVTGMEGLIETASISDADIVVTAVVGMMGIEPTIAAIKAHKNVALANKETLVCAGHIIMPLAKNEGVKILPVDSEHSAIFQCLQGRADNRIRKILLTASGGPFLHKSLDELKSVKVEDALKHPNWNMGAKVTIDSSTMVNKGLEVCEASWLFDTKPSDIEVVIQPQSIVHSAVEFEDQSAGLGNEVVSIVVGDERGSRSCIVILLGVDEAPAQRSVVAVVDVPVEFQAHLIRISIFFRCAEDASIVVTLQGSQRFDVVENFLSSIEVDLRIRSFYRVSIIILLLGTLEIGEEEELILDQRTTEGSAEGVVGHVAILSRSLAVVELILVGDHVTILEVRIDTSVKIVGTRLGDGIDSTTGETGLTHVERSDRNLQLVDSLHRKGLRASLSTIGTILCQTEDVVRHGTVDHDSVVAVVGAGEVHSATLCHLHEGVDTCDISHTVIDGRQLLDTRVVDRLCGTVPSVVDTGLTSDNDFTELFSVSLKPDGEVV